MPRRRLDEEMVSRGLFPSREQAAGAIAEGRVVANGSYATKPAALVNTSASIHVEGPPGQFVSRGGQKLAAALDAFEVPVLGKACLDAGAGTGGFTDCLLQAGARTVCAVDVGYGQLAWRIRNDPRVKVLERTNARYLRPEQLDEAPEVVTADLSFISLRLVIPTLRRCAGPQADFVVLIKPQFEAGKAKVPSTGVIRDPQIHREVLNDFLGWCTAEGIYATGLIASPLRGAQGNIEFLARLAETDRGPAAAVAADRVEEVVEGAWES